MFSPVINPYADVRPAPEAVLNQAVGNPNPNMLTGWNGSGIPLPTYNPAYNPSTMALLPQYMREVAANDQGYQSFSKEALRRGPSAWAGLAKVQQALEARNQRENAAQQAAAAGTEEENKLAMTGGLSSGARERAATAAANATTKGAQDVNRQEQMNNMQIGLNDEQQRLQELSQLPGMEQGRISGWENVSGRDLQNLLQENQARNQFNMGLYNTQMQAWAAEKQAEATEHSGKGGGK